MPKDAQGTQSPSQRPLVTLHTEERNNCSYADSKSNSNKDYVK